MHSPTSPRHDFQQLPLPTTVNTTPAQRPQGGTTVSTIAGPAAPLPRSLPPVVGRPSGEYQTPNSPIQSSFSHLHSTHAGGIQPSMSFFRPSRPNYDRSDLSRPASAASVNDNEGHGRDSVSFQMGELNQRHSDVCDDDGSRAVSDVDTNAQNLLPRRTKSSREPLLPIADPSGSLLNKLAMPRDRSGTGSSVPAKNIVRTSFDRVMGLSRGLSLDSVRKASPTRPALIEGRPGKEGDGSYAYNLPTSSTTYDCTSFGAMYVDASTENRNSGLRTSISHSPDLLFNPRPRHQQPPLSAVPILNLDTKKPTLNHQHHPSNNKFFFRGRFLTGGDSPWAFVTSFLLVLVIAGVWFGTTCVWWWQNESPAVAAIGIYMALLVISSMLATATTDPGILPRDLDPDPPYSNETRSDGGSRVPMPRDLKVRNDVVRTKYCVTCRTYRPPRSSHCKMCDNCVDGCDHHCQWVNNCVGRRNYTSFFVLLLSASLTLVLIICTSALHLYLLTTHENINFRQALKRGAGSAVVFCLSILVFWPVVALLLYHMRLLLLNVTTIEQIRNQAHKSLIPDAPPPNPFSHGSWKRNLVNVLCRPAGYSWLNASAIATEDKREVNPALIGGEIWDGPHHQR